MKQEEFLSEVRDMQLRVLQRVELTTVNSFVHVSDQLSAARLILDFDPSRAHDELAPVVGFAQEEEEEEADEKEEEKL